ncbi:MAG: hypothetical protein V4710_10525 [Verrucomicrobiota bacterium]
MNFPFAAVFLFFGGSLWLQAFPPAPNYTLYGLVRNQVGHTIMAEGAELVLLKGTVEVGRAPIKSGLQLDQNYELQVRIDQNRNGTTLYSEKAIVAESVFNIVVEMNGTRFLPIEAAGSLTAGKGGERTRLDLNLGEDANRDGLPDIWQEWQLYQAGFQADESGHWPLDRVPKGGDLDGDGQSNWQEYLAGTFAGDASETFSLTVREKSANSIRFEFYTITGKTYTLERSVDFTNWTRIAFAVGSPGIGAQAYSATAIGVVSAFAAPLPSGTREFYRLTVR